MNGLYEQAAKVAGLDDEHWHQQWPPALAFRHSDTLEQPAEFSIDAKSQYTYRVSQGSIRVPIDKPESAARNLDWNFEDEEDKGDPPPLACMRVVKIKRNRNRELLVNRKLLFEIFRVFELDYYALYLYHSITPGFHVLDCQDANAKGQRTLRFYLNHQDSVIIWSYNTVTRAALAVAIVGEDHSAAVLYDGLKSQLPNDIIYSPFALVLVAIIQGFLVANEGRQTESHDNHSQLRKRGLDFEEFYHVRSMELGHACSDVLDDLSATCLRQGVVITETEHCLKVLKSVQTLADKLEDPKLWDMVAASCDLSDGHVEETHQEILETVQFLQPQMADRVVSLTHLQREARDSLALVSPLLQCYPTLHTTVSLNWLTQTAKIMSRITRTDATVNKRDSSSMKVIAIMTMAFLPATFFATLFSVPSLKWDADAPSVIQPSFWVYVACTLPTTVLVFLVWAVCTGRLLAAVVERIKITYDVLVYIHCNRGVEANSA
jgi:hypothetical protein